MPPIIDPPDFDARQLGREHLQMLATMVAGVPLEAAAEKWLETGSNRQIAHATACWAVEIVAKDAKAAGVEFSAEEFWEICTWGSLVGPKFTRQVLSVELPTQPEAPDPRGQAPRDLVPPARRYMAYLEHPRWNLVQSPLNSDLLEIWFASSIVRSLSRIGIDTVNALTLSIERAPLSWYRNVPGIDEKTASRIARWVQRNAPTLSQIRRNARLRAGEQYEEKTFGIVPLERLHVPVLLAGYPESGLGWRSPEGWPCPENDLAAVGLWLQGIGSANFSSRRNAIETCMLWATLVREKPLSRLTTADLSAYGAFLQAPAPQERWVMQGFKARDSLLWKPLSGALGPSQIESHFAIIRPFFNWMRFHGYVDQLLVFPRIKSRTPHPIMQAALSIEELRLCMSYFEHHSHDEAGRRATCIIWLALACGLTAAEMHRAKISDLTTVEMQKGTRRTTIRVAAGSDRYREIDVPARLYDHLLAYTDLRGLGRIPRHVATIAPLFAAHLRHDPGYANEPATRSLVAKPQILCGTPIGPEQVSKIATTLFSALAQYAADSGSPCADHLRRGTYKWLRNTFGIMQLRSGTSTYRLQYLLGHKSPNTTLRYLEALRQEERDRYRPDAAT